MPTVLILEDDLLLADDWRALLGAAGLGAVHARTATEAAQILRRERVDLVLADIFVEVEGQLTPDGGITLLGMAREAQLDGRMSVPVVAVSGAPTDGPYATRVLDLARTMGAVETLSKPVSPAELLACVRKYV